MRSIPVTLKIIQVVDGGRYKGYLQFGGIQLDYELEFSIVISQVDDSIIDEVSTIEDIRENFPLAMKKEGRDIELSDEEYGIFFSILLDFIVEFYNVPVVRQVNSGRSGDVDTDEGGKLPAFITGASISIEYRFMWRDIDPGLQTLLTAPKFGCAFPN